MAYEEAIRYWTLNGRSWDDLEGLLAIGAVDKLAAAVENFELMMLPLDVIEKAEHERMRVALNVDSSHRRERARVLRELLAALGGRLSCTEPLNLHVEGAGVVFERRSKELWEGAGNVRADPHSRPSTPC